LNVSNAIKHNLRDEIECVVWTDGFFSLSRTTLDTLIARIDEFDLGVFVFGRDDTITSRGTVLSATRDNVIYEFGLFCGRLGPHRTFVVRPIDKSLKWLTDLDGFTPALYDDELAKTNAERAVKEACEKIRHDLDHILPRPSLYLSRERTRLGSDWWTYGGAEASSTVADEDGIQLITQESIGLMYPRFDNLDARGRFCAVRFMPMPDSASRRLYISLRAETEKFLLALSDSHLAEGWGAPHNEFMIRLPHLDENRHRAVVIDLEELTPYMGNVLAVNGFRIRPGVRVSHLCVCDELPPWLKGAYTLHPTDAPLITIEQPTANAVVERAQFVEGRIRLRKQVVKENDLQVFVLAPDNFWYPQGPLTIANGRWKVQAYFGTKTLGAGSEFTIGVITTNGAPATEMLRELPPASGRSVIRVTRRSE
jgi:hypothetical protein